MRLPWRRFGGDKRDDKAKFSAAEKIVNCRAVFWRLMSVRGTRAPRCLPSSQIQKRSEATRISDGDRGDERDGKAKNRRVREKMYIQHDSLGAWSRCE